MHTYHKIVAFVMLLFAIAIFGCGVYDFLGHPPTKGQFANVMLAIIGSAGQLVAMAAYVDEAHIDNAFEARVDSLEREVRELVAEAATSRNFMLLGRRFFERSYGFLERLYGLHFLTN